LTLNNWVYKDGDKVNRTPCNVPNHLKILIPVGTAPVTDSIEGMVTYLFDTGTSFALEFKKSTGTGTQSKSTIFKLNPRLIPFFAAISYGVAPAESAS
jgi:hypothetical protein